MDEIPEHDVPEENNTKSERTGVQEDVPYLALDIGGKCKCNIYLLITNMMKALEHRSHPVHGGWLHFVKFETREINECLDFIKFKQLHCQVGTDPESKKGIAAKFKVTGAGAHKFADLFMGKIGVTVEKEDEMDCLAIGANFLLKKTDLVKQTGNPNEAFTFIEGKKESVDIDKNDLFPYLYVNIGSGVIEGDGNYETVDGTRIGGITCWGIGRLLTKCKSFNEIIELSKCGNIKRIDLFVEDTFGDREYVEKHAQKLNAPPNMNIGSFGKTISENKTLEDCNVEDLSMSLLQMFSLNIAQIASLNSRIYGIKRIFFGGSFIKDNTCSLKILSSSVHYHSKGTAKAMYLRHEGFVGALGALMNVETTLKSTFSCHDPLWNFRD
ncbi:hypothetical protein MKW92_043752 [Papaver armeniacum]|nr:hypothetical protein MKW92_043752 [Papaver armeniacum]